MSQGETLNAEDQVLKNIVSYWNQLVILNNRLSEAAPVAEQATLKQKKQDYEIILLKLFDKFTSRLEFAKQVQASAEVINVARGVRELRTFLTKSTVRITAKEQEAFVDNYTKVLQLANDAAAKYCAAISEGLQNDSDVLKNHLKHSTARIEELEEEIRKTKEQALKQIGQTGEESVEKSKQIHRAKDDYNKLKESHRSLLEVEKALRKEVAELNQDIRTKKKELVDITTYYEKEVNSQEQALCTQEDEIDQLKNQVNTLQTALQVANANLHVNPIPPNNQANMASADDIKVAVTTAFQTIISEEDKKRIPTFPGNTKERSFEEWIKIADRVAKKNGWDDDTKFKNYCDRLEGGAADFNEKGLWPPNTQDDAKNLTLWLKGMRGKYTTAMDKERLRHQLTTSRQKTEQSMQDFVDQINDLYKQAYGAELADSTVDLVKKSRDDIKSRVLSAGILQKYRNEFWNRTKDIEQDFEALAQVAITAEQIVQRREILEQSCVIAGIVEDRSEDKEAIEEQKRKVEAVEKDLAEFKEKVTVNAIQPQFSNSNRGAGRGRGSYNYNQRGRGGYNYNSRGQNQGYQNNRPSYGPARQGNYNNQGRQDQGYGNFQPNVGRDDNGARPRYQPQNQASGGYHPPTGNQGRGGGIANKVCYHCQKVGHIARQCRSNPANQQQNSNPRGNCPRNNHQQNNPPQGGYPQNNYPRPNYPQNNSIQPRYPQDNVVNAISQEEQ
jgi:Zinc knuckle